MDCPRYNCGNPISWCGKIKDLQIVRTVLGGTTVYQAQYPGNSQAAGGVEFLRGTFMRIRVPVLAGIISFVAAVAWAQDPSLTGNWTRGDRSNGVTCKIDQQGADVTFHVVSHFSNSRLSGGMNDSETYTADGVERERKANNGRQIWLTTYWQGRSLVISRLSKDGYHVVATRETWTVSDDGLTLTKTMRRIDMDGVTESTEEFARN